MEIEVERGREAMGEEDERGRGLSDSVRSATARTKQSWDSRELCLCLRDEEGEAAVWDSESESWDRVSEIVNWRWEADVLGCEVKWNEE